MEDSPWQEIGELLGSSVRHRSAVGGGDINEAYRADLADGRRVFVKVNRRCPDGMFQAEAKGLRWLAEANAVRVPMVLAHSQPSASSGFLVLEHVESGRPAAAYDEMLGHQLANLHRFGAPSVGLDHPNYIGTLPQSNEPKQSWHQFFAEQRLVPMLERAARAGLVNGGLRRRFDRLLAALEGLLGGEEAPSRLHGDLWGGNAMCDASGHPVLVDPAVYGGDREVDLAMMRLFGGFSARTLAAYAEAYPLRPGHGDRISLYQLYPLLVHVNLFGSGYLGSVDSALSRYV